MVLSPRKVECGQVRLPMRQFCFEYHRDRPVCEQWCSCQELVRMERLSSTRLVVYSPRCTLPGPNTSLLYCLAHLVYLLDTTQHRHRLRRIGLQHSQKTESRDPAWLAHRHRARSIRWKSRRPHLHSKPNPTRRGICLRFLGSPVPPAVPDSVGGLSGTLRVSGGDT